VEVCFFFRRERMGMTLKLTRNVMFLLAGLALAGCSNMGEVVGSSTTPVATEPDLVSTRIAQAAERASKALDTISGIEQERAPHMPAEDNYSSAPPALMQAITIKWSGPIDQVAKMLSDKAGMKFQSIGSRSGVPVVVSLDVYQKPLIEVLKDIGLQAGRRADISVNSVSNTIEIRYAPVDRT
jgi:defect in organelle trafficking protein DotD